MTKRVLFAIALLLIFSTTASATVIYEQPPISPVTSVRPSQFITGPPDGPAFGFRTFDNFTLGTTELVNDVHWRGAYFNTLIDPNTAPTANATGFGVDFYASNGSGPVVPPLSTHTFSIAQVNETFVGNQLVTLASGTQFTAAIFDYDVILATPFAAAAGTEFWLNVYAFTPSPSSTEAQWGWVGGSGGDGTSLLFFPVDTSLLVPTEVQQDRAFALTTAVPEPAMLTVLAAGALASGVAALRRRRR